MKILEALKTQLSIKLSEEPSLHSQTIALFHANTEPHNLEKILRLSLELLSLGERNELFFKYLKSYEDLSFLQSYVDFLSSQDNKKEAIELLESLAHLPNFLSPLFLRQLLFRTKMRSEEKTKLQTLFCHHPFDTFSIWPNGEVTFCCRLPSIGNIYQESFEEIWNSPKAQEIRESITNGTFKYCNLYDCDPYRRGLLQNRKDICLEEVLPPRPPTEGHWGGSSSCALACKWCRKEVCFDPEEKKLFDHEKDLYQYYRHCETIYTSSSAEFSDSAFTLSLIKQLGAKTPSGKTRLWRLATNGISFTPQIWRTIEESCQQVRLSVTGRSLDQKTFAQVSPNSSLDEWLSNMDFYLKQRSTGRFLFLRLKIVVSSLNFKELPSLIHWAKEKKVDEIVFRRLHQWGALEKNEMDELDVCHPAHPQYPELLEILKTISPSEKVILRDLV